MSPLKCLAPSSLLFAWMFALWIGGAAVMAEDWPAFRGPRGDGTVAGTGFPHEWSRSKNIAWRVPLPEPGNSSPIVVGDQVFITFANPDGTERTLACFHRHDGQERWRRTVRYEKTEETHKTNPFSPATPVSDGQAVYVWHGSAGMHAYALDGSSLWTADLGTFEHIWGLGSSPVLYGDLVVQLGGPGERTFLAALDRKTGSTRWQTPIEQGGSASRSGRYVGTWITPVLVSIQGQDQWLVPFHSRVVGIDPKSGKELWSIDGLSNERSDLVYASPMVAKDRVVIMGGFGGPEFAFRMENAQVTEKERLWRNIKLNGKSFHPQRIGTGVTLGDYLFMANADEAGSIECIDTRTGERKWSERRTTDGPHWGSMVMADGKLFIPGQKKTRVIQADPERYQLLAENDLEEHSNSTPAFSKGEIFIRTFDALYCIRQESP